MSAPLAVPVLTRDVVAHLCEIAQSLPYRANLGVDPERIVWVEVAGEERIGVAYTPDDPDGPHWMIAILRLDDHAYAIPIREEIEERTSRKVARGALYTALDRLEAKHCVRSRMSEPLPERGGRARRYFSVTPTGLAALRSSRQALLKLWSGLERRLES